MKSIENILAAVEQEIMDCTSDLIAAQVYKISAKRYEDYESVDKWTMEIANQTTALRAALHIHSQMFEMWEYEAEFASRNNAIATGQYRGVHQVQEDDGVTDAMIRQVIDPVPERY